MGKLWATVAIAALVPAFSLAQSIRTDCTLVDGVLPADCRQPNVGTSVTMPVGENTELEVYDSDLGEEGFSISIDADVPGDDPILLEGDAARVNQYRRVDRILSDNNVEVRFDGLNIDPVLAISTEELRSTYRGGDTVRFRASSNYPNYIDKAEIRVAEARNPARVVARIPVAPNGTANWTMPSVGERDLVYSLRVYDARGRYDETRTLSISRTARILPDPVLDGPVIAAGETENMTRRRSIPVEGGAVTVFSNGIPAGSTVTVLGEAVPVDANGAFVVQRILPVGTQNVSVGVGSKTINRTVEIPKSDWFYIATIDVTVGKENDQVYRIGRVAGFAKGRTASGWSVTAAIDTKEGDLDEIFRDIDAREPLNLLRSIKDEDVYLTFGDDSTLVEEAPTSGKLYLRAEKNGSHILLGDFKLAEESLSLVRSDRTLFGIEGEYVSPALTNEGRPRFRFSAYAATPDRLAQRDVLEGTGGSIYFLQRQDILSGSATIFVQWRDPVTGRIVREERLVEGTDYTINYFQGIVQLTSPLSPYGGDGLLTDTSLGRYEVNLVAQYEYVPTLTDVDGSSGGARVETWLNDNVRIGLSGQREQTGPADNTLVGADLLLRRSDLTYLNLQVAESEGPGFGLSNSLNGGFDFADDPTTGVRGMSARAYSLEARADLAEVTNGAVSGTFAAYYDKKEEGFVSADFNIGVTQTSYGVATNVDLSDVTSLTLAYDYFEDDSGKRREDARIAASFRLNQQWTAEIAALHTDRMEPTAAPRFNGSRTDLAVRLLYERDEDYSAWIFAQATVDQSGGLPDNDRYGVGTRLRVSDKVTIAGEVSDGSLGSAGYANIEYQKDADTQYYLGYRLDPYRREADTAFSGSDGGTWVVGAQSRINDKVTVRAENTYDLYGDRPSLASTYGVTYTPNNLWAFDGGLIYGEKEDPVTGVLRREGLSLGAHYTQGEQLRAGISGEYHREKSSSDPTLDRRTWGISAYARYKVSEELRLLANIDAIVSESDQNSIRDGRYVEANLGMAYRPIDNDRFNALFRYTYLEDLPGPDQVNLEGDLNGPRQKSHILSADVSYDLDRQFTLGGKYGYRKAEVETVRGSDVFTSNTAHLGIVRLDYHVVHNWDITAEYRVMWFEEANVTEQGGMIGVWRHFGNNVKAGVGYQIGDVDDDLRRIDGRKEGPFFNIIAKF